MSEIRKCKVLCNRELNMQCAWVDRTVCDQVEDTTEKKTKTNQSMKSASGQQNLNLTKHRSPCCLLQYPHTHTPSHTHTHPQTRLVKILSRKFLTRQSAKASNLYKYSPPPPQVPLNYLYKRMYSAKIE